MTSLSILIVEDDLLIGLLLTDMLQAMGHDVCGVERTESGAVESALLNRPDLIIVDARLNTGSGITAVERISATVAIPHIFVSGDRAAIEGVSRCVLQKPFTQRDLTRAIAGTINVARRVTDRT